jgi:peptidoglycan-associated lipoprotein
MTSIKLKPQDISNPFSDQSLMKKQTSFCLLIASIVLLTGCARMHISQGNRYYDNLGYGMAAEHYLKALELKDNLEAQIRLADCYVKTGNYVKAETWYAKVVEMPEATTEHKVQYARILMNNGKCEDAKKWANEAIRSTPGDLTAERVIKSCNMNTEFVQDSLKYAVEQMKFNSSGSDYSATFYKDGLVFVSERTPTMKRYTAEYTGRAYTDLYYSKKESNQAMWSIPELLSGDINGQFHEGPASFPQGTDMVYFTRNNLNKKKLVKDAKDVVNLKIYEAKLEGNEWKNVQPLSLNNNEYSTGHPALTSDGKTMYFISDMPGGVGGADIYVSTSQNGVWSTPVNLGEGINTPGNEMFPFLFADSILYFSSNGMPGLGGLDIYSTTLRKGEWQPVEHLSYPVNSIGDDFGYSLESAGRMGYFSSNRGNDQGIDNIYRFIRKDILIKLEGIVVDKATQKPIPIPIVELINLDSQRKERLVAGADGTFMTKIDPFSAYTIMASKDNHFGESITLSEEHRVAPDKMFIKLELEYFELEKPIVLQNIYYDFDKWNIRDDAKPELDKLVKVLKNTPNITVELGSHTDSRGTDKYNEHLSEKRAQSAVSYIVERGIHPGRIIAKGYGESRLVNNCKDDATCTEEEHQQNRRTEVKVTKADRLEQ